MEDAYILVQEQLLEGLSVLKEDCRTLVRQQEVLMHTDMDQILNTRRQLEEKIRGTGDGQQEAARVQSEAAGSGLTSRFVFYSQSFRACREALLRVRSAVPGLGSGGDDGTHQLRFPGGSAAE